MSMIDLVHDEFRSKFITEIQATLDGKYSLVSAEALNFRYTMKILLSLFEDVAKDVARALGMQDVSVLQTWQPNGAPFLPDEEIRQKVLREIVKALSD